MNIETAVIPVAGAGTRMWPSATAVPKCMSEVHAGERDRPIVDYMVEDCALGGIKRVIFVIAPRDEAILKDYFEEINPDLEARALRAGGNEAKLDAERERRRSYDLTYNYVVQPNTEYGTAYPPIVARDLLRGEPHFALFGGDDFVYRQDGGSELADAIKLWEESGSDHVIMGNPLKPEDDPTKFGILKIGNDGMLNAIQEKPARIHVPAHPVANISRYLLSADMIWPHLDAEMAIDRGEHGEHPITEPINSALAEGQTFQVHVVSGEYFDGGNPGGLRHASNWITDHPVVR